MQSNKIPSQVPSDPNRNWSDSLTHIDHKIADYPKVPREDTEKPDMSSKEGL